jgi:hypothetical protein
VAGWQATRNMIVLQASICRLPGLQFSIGLAMAEHARRRPRMRRIFILMLTLAGMGCLAGFMTVSGLPAPASPSAVQSVWTETQWPFLMDQWGIGKAFVCGPADCGARIEVYVRPKIGFCNCSTGVSDDAELERVADTELLSPEIRPLGPDRPVKVGWMLGLSRAYRISGEQTGERLLSVAFNDECDVVVAVAKLGNGDPNLAEPAVVAFLSSRPMVLWAKKELGLEFVRREW